MAGLKANFELMAAAGPVRHPCGKCKRDTNHMMVTGFREDGSHSDSDGNGFDWTIKSMVMQCLGCETVAFYRESTNSEERDWIDGEYFIDASHFPPLSKHSPRFEAHEVPMGLSSIYEETIKALDGGQPILAAVGIRAIVETICNDLEVKGRDLKAKIAELQAKALVTAEGARCLQTLREVGNDAAHRVHRHKTPQLVAAIKVVEHLIEGTYLLPRAIDNAFKPKANAVPVPVPFPVAVPPAAVARVTSPPVRRVLASSKPPKGAPKEP